MKSKLIVSALLNIRNLALLAILLGGTYLIGPSLHIPFGDIILPSASAAVYLGFVTQSLSSKSFNENFNRKQKVKRIQNLNYTCLKLTNEARKHVNSVYMQKLRRVIDDKNEIVNSFFRGEHSFLREKIVEQTLNLVHSYLRLLNNFCIRNRELSEKDVGEITARINNNVRRMNFSKDQLVAGELKRTIETDEKLINRLRDEKTDLERTAAKLDFMESTVNLLKQQILSSIETEEMVETIETAVNEAEALDNVLEERRRNRVNL